MRRSCRHRQGLRQRRCSRYKPADTDCSKVLAAVHRELLQVPGEAVTGVPKDHRLLLVESRIPGGQDWYWTLMREVRASTGATAEGFSSIDLS
jgi:hypothetical protein